MVICELGTGYVQGHLVETKELVKSGSATLLVQEKSALSIKILIYLRNIAVKLEN